MLVWLRIKSRWTSLCRKTGFWSDGQKREKGKSSGHMEILKRGLAKSRESQKLFFKMIFFLFPKCRKGLFSFVHQRPSTKMKKKSFRDSVSSFSFFFLISVLSDPRLVLCHWLFTSEPTLEKSSSSFFISGFLTRKKNSDDCKSFFSKFVTLKKERDNFSSVFWIQKCCFWFVFNFRNVFFQGEKEFHHRTELFLLDIFSSLPSGPNVHFSAKNVRKVINW